MQKVLSQSELITLVSAYENETLKQHKLKPVIMKLLQMRVVRDSSWLRLKLNNSKFHNMTSKL